VGLSLALGLALGGADDAMANSSCRLISKPRIAHVLKQKRVKVIGHPDELTSGSGHVQSRCAYQAYGGRALTNGEPDAPGTRRHARRFANGSLAEFQITLDFPETGPDAGVWNDEDPTHPGSFGFFVSSKQEALIADPGAKLDAQHEMRLALSPMFAERAAGARNVVGKLNTVDGLWWSTRAHTLLTLTLLESRHRPTVKRLSQLARTVVPAVF
jgi:hypothetical protein